VRATSRFSLKSAPCGDNSTSMIRPLRRPILSIEEMRNLLSPSNHDQNLSHQIHRFQRGQGGKHWSLIN
jgi:hypothetical protein